MDLICIQKCILIFNCGQWLHFQSISFGNSNNFAAQKRSPHDSLNHSSGGIDASLPTGILNPSFVQERNNFSSSNHFELQTK